MRDGANLPAYGRREHEGDPDVPKLALSGEVDAGSRPPAYRVKLIDFAHTKLKSEQDGVDKGMILGLENTTKCIEGRRQEIMSGFDSSHVFCFIVHCTYLLVIHATWT